MDSPIVDRAKNTYVSSGLSVPEDLDFVLVAVARLTLDFTRHWVAVDE